MFEPHGRSAEGVEAQAADAGGDGGAAVADAGFAPVVAGGHVGEVDVYLVGRGDAEEEEEQEEEGGSGEDRSAK